MRYPGLPSNSWILTLIVLQFVDDVRSRGMVPFYGLGLAPVELFLAKKKRAQVVQASGA